MKKAIVFLLSGAMSLSLMACSHAGTAQAANPFTECASMEEAVKNAGFSFNVPASVDGYAQRIVRTMTDEDSRSMIEVIYCDDDADSENEVRIRKAAGNDDISGDYTTYAESNSLTVGDVQVSVKGENGNIKLATWVNGNYTYSVGFYSNAGISSEKLAEFITSVQ